MYNIYIHFQLTGRGAPPKTEYRLLLACFNACANLQIHTQQQPETNVPIRITGYSGAAGVHSVEPYTPVINMRGSTRRWFLARRKHMNIQQQTSSSKITKIVLGVILFAVCAAMRLAPAGVRDDSGFGFILVAILLGLGSYLLYTGIFTRR